MRVPVSSVMIQYHLHRARVWHRRAEAFYDQYPCGATLADYISGGRGKRMIERRDFHIERLKELGFQGVGS